MNGASFAPCNRIRHRRGGNHQELAAGGVGMTTVAYAAVANAGRAYPHQLCLWKPGTLPGLRRFMSRAPIAVMRGRVPYRELRRSMHGFLAKLGALAFARLLVRPVPFREAYFLAEARRVRQAVSIPLILVGGLRTLARMEEIVREGFQFITMARPFFAEPDLVRRFEAGIANASRCEPCNRCLAALAAGEAKCPVLPH